MRFYIVQGTAQGPRPLPYTERGFPNRSAAYRFLAKSGESYCRVSNREASLHARESS